MSRPGIFPSFRALFGPRRSTETQRRAVLRLVAVAAEERLPLAPLLEDWSQSERGGQRQRLWRLATVLRAGTPLPDALERVPGVLSDDETLMIRFATESGVLAPTIRRRLDSDHETDALLKSNLRTAKTYLAMLVFVGFPLIIWINTFIAPALREVDPIFRDLGAQGTPATTFSSYVSSAVGRLWLLLIAGLALAEAAWSFVGPRRFFQRRVAPRLLSALRSRRVAEVLQRLGECASAGRPLPGAISTLARHHYDPSIRNKLLFVRNELELGAGLWPTLTSAGLLSYAESAALATSDDVGVRAWTLASLADRRRRNADQRLTLQSSLLAPLAIFLFAAFVLIQSVGVISWMSNLIFSLA